MVMWSVGVMGVVRNVLSVRVRLGPYRVGTFDFTVRRVHGDLGRHDAAANHAGDFHSGIGEAEASGQCFQPFGSRTGIDQGTEQHVPADSCCRIENREASRGHAEISLSVEGRGKSGF